MYVRYNKEDDFDFRLDSEFMEKWNRQRSLPRRVLRSMGWTMFIVLVIAAIQVILED